MGEKKFLIAELSLLMMVSQAVPFHIESIVKFYPKAEYERVLVDSLKSISGREQ